jgi:long-subunit acyl-CoA synthetase (AMP-forming)
MAWALGVGKDYSQKILHKEPVSSLLKLKHTLADRLVFTKLRGKLGGRLRFFISGGAPLDKELAEFFLSVGVMIPGGLWVDGNVSSDLGEPPAQFEARHRGSGAAAC